MQVLVSSGTERVPEVRVAANEVTLLHFDAPLDRASVEVEARTTRFHWVDVGDTFLALEPSVDLGVEERLMVRARYKDGAPPSTLTLTLVTRPSVVDKEVSVIRQTRTREALEERVAELESDFATLKTQCEGSGLPQLVFSGLLDPDIKVIRFQGRMSSGYVGGLKARPSASYRDSRWAMVVLQVSNLPGHDAWVLSTARLTSVSGTALKVRSVHMDRPRLEAGDSALVAVMVDPPGTIESSYQLELVDTSGGLHPVSNIMLRGDDP